MNKERIGLGILAVFAVALLGWNIKLQSDISALQAGVSDGHMVASADHGEAATAGHDADGHRRGSDRHRTEAHRPGAAASGGEDFQGNDAVVVAGEEGEGEGRRRGRRGRMDWDQVRSEMETNTVDIVESFAATHKWEPKVADDILTILLDSSDEIGQLWSEAHSDEGEDRSRYQIHKDMEEIQGAAEDEISELVGQDAYDALAEEIYEARHETFRRSHDG